MLLPVVFWLAVGFGYLASEWLEHTKDDILGRDTDDDGNDEVDDGDDADEQKVTMTMVKCCKRLLFNQGWGVRAGIARLAGTTH